MSETPETAIQWTGQNWAEVCAFLGVHASADTVRQEPDRTYVVIHTLEGDMRAYPGDWLVKDVKDGYSRLTCRTANGAPREH